MSFSEAIAEMLLHLDGLVGTLPAPVGNAAKIPADVVVLRSVVKKQNGIGLVSEEDPLANMIIEEGQFIANIDIALWSSKSDNVVDRSRVFMTEIFNMDNTTTENGIFRNLDLDNSAGPDYYDDGKLWRLSVGVTSTFEYRYEKVPGTGIISQIPISMEGELEEEFVVS